MKTGHLILEAERLMMMLCHLPPVAFFCLVDFLECGHIRYSHEISCAVAILQSCLSTEGVEGVLLPASPPSGTVLEAKIRCVLLAAWFTLT